MRRTDITSAQRWGKALAGCCVLLTLLTGLGQPAQGQIYAPCGVVDAIDYPIDITDTRISRYDDFGLLRPRFGGNHVGVDIGFNRWGEPVHAAARGLVTFSDINAWDTEKGVVVIEHTFPDGSIAYSVYGHMEQGDTTFFPAVGTCVERGDVVGLIGWPSRGLPHLHYEIRRILASDGGPGYVSENPTDAGWYHPFDFTELWRVRLSGGYLGAVTFRRVPSLPPVQLESGGLVIASGQELAGYSPAGELLWRVNADGVITGLAPLPGDRVAAHTRNGQALTLQNGRFVAVWSVMGPDAPLIARGETLIFVTDGGGLAAYAPDGTPLWELPANIETAALQDTPPRVLSVEPRGDEVALAVRLAGEIEWRVIGADGALRFRTTLSSTPVVAANPSGWYVLDGARLYRIEGETQIELAIISPPPGRTARLTADVIGNVYVYVGDAGGTLIALDANGDVRWRTTYPTTPTSLAPTLDVGGGCILYALDADGTLNVFDTGTGALARRITLYAGGEQNSSPRARLLRADRSERMLLGSGFLTVVALDGAQLAPDAMQSCLLG